MKATAFIDHQTRTVTVCAWCFPGRSYFAQRPEHAGIAYYDLNHSICKEHLAQQKWIVGGCVGPFFFNPTNLVLQSR